MEWNFSPCSQTSFSSSPSSSCDENDEESDVRWLLSKQQRNLPNASPAAPNNHIPKSTNTSNSSLINKTILHLDVDCFYCQCEANADPTGKLSSAPFAIGQKHIVVTCNYVARKLGIQKLMLKTTAMKICPQLVIIDGSDLTRYKIQSRRIYMAFRKAVKSLPDGNKNLVCKGFMDEMFADITESVHHSIRNPSFDSFLSKIDSNSVFVYGNQSSTVSISEDQSGVKATICLSQAARHEIEDIPTSPSSSTHSVEHNASSRWGTKQERKTSVKLLKWASNLAHKIKQEVLKETGFSTCIGVSVSPMLAKIASDLKKPNSINVLYPWRSTGILKSMPLRRIPQLGSRTLKLLNECLKEEHPHDPLRGTKEGAFWTCSDLLQVPKHRIITCLLKSKQYHLNCEEHAESLLQRCQGVDISSIVDDGGRPAKTVSVEDSFRRGTLTTRRQVFEALEPLFVRLIPLVEERRVQSISPSSAYPTTIRVCVRNLIEEENRVVRRETFQKQNSFPGQKMIAENSLEDQTISLLRSAIIPLVRILLPNDSMKNNNNVSINVTRINIAVMNFSDCKEQLQKEGNFYPKTLAPSHSTIDSMFHRQQQQQKEKMAQTYTSRCAESNRKITKALDHESSNFTKGSDMKTFFHQEQSKGNLESKSLKSERIPFTSQPAKPNITKKSHSFQSHASLPEDIDPDVLAELPADIVEEIFHQSRGQQKEMTSNTSKKRGIKAFFPTVTKKRK